MDVVKMVKLIMGLKGSGKTKKLIKLINDAVDNEHGDIVCIEKAQKMTYDIPYKVRLIDASQYGFDGYDFFKGFISGLHSANYDITHIFIDNVLMIVGRELDNSADDFFEWCDKFSKKEHVSFTITISEDIALASDGAKRFL